MNRLVLSLWLVTGFLAAGAQKTINDPEAEKRTVSGFHGIEVSTGIHLLLTQGNTEEVAVSASRPEYRDRIETVVENGVLKIRYKTRTGAINRIHEDKALRAYVSCRTLDLLHANTGADITIEGKLNVPSLEMEANTGAHVTGEFNLDRLRVDQSTGSKMTLSGQVASMSLEGSTGSKFFGEDLQVNTCEAEVSTGAALFIRVDKQLNARASTGGYIKYKGEGGLSEVKTSTGGHVSRI
ncbi:MAG TPA: head GIN domain-containing protein [Chitinophagaceae bacterium]|nr:head GIN domain-containing protein [Chitinophagaceae bacterium]